MAIKIINLISTKIEDSIIDVTALPKENIDTKRFYRLTEQYPGTKKPKITYWYYNNSTWQEQIAFIDTPEMPTENVRDCAWYRVPVGEETRYFVSNDGAVKSYMDNTASEERISEAKSDFQATLAAKEEELNIIRTEHIANLEAKETEFTEALKAPQAELNDIRTEHVIAREAKNAEVKNAIAAAEANKENTLIDLEDELEEGVINFIEGDGADKLVIPNGITYVAPYAFYNRKYTSISIPSSITNIGENAFLGCDRITTVIYGGTYTEWIEKDLASNFDAVDYILVCSDLCCSQDGMQYELNTNGTSYSLVGVAEDSSSSVEVASSLNSLPVTRVKASSFANRTDIESVVIPDSVTVIDEGTFSGCSGLVSITLPFVGSKVSQTETSTPRYPFGYIFGTASYTGGTEVQQRYYKPGASTFTDITYYIPDSLKNITINGGNILSYAFYNCNNLSNVTIGDGIKFIGSYAFYNCYNLMNIVIPDSVTSVGQGAFTSCDSLTSIPTMNGVTELGNVVFQGCDGFVDITVPGYIKTMPSQMFYNCNNLVNVTIEHGVESIGSLAFWSCDNLTSILISDTVNNIGIGIFAEIPTISNIVVDSNNKKYHSSNNCIIETDSKTLVYSCANSIIPSDGTVEHVGAAAFAYCSNLTNIVLPDGIKSIGNEAFTGCSGLTDITIPDSVTSIGNSAFYSCTGLKNVTMPNQLITIGKNAFYNCNSLTNISIPDGVISVGESAFYGCKRITSVSLGSTEASFGKDAFKNCSLITSVYITDLHSWLKINFENDESNPRYIGTSVLYLNNQPISGDIVIPDDVSKINSYAFQNTNITSVLIPNTTTSIGRCAFYGCSDLTSITIPENIITISKNAFGQCVGLTEINYNAICANNLQSNNFVFYDAGRDGTGITLTIGEKVTLIPSYLLYPRSSREVPFVTSVVFKDRSASLSIGYMAFAYSPMRNIVMSDNITSIGAYAFQGCTNLTSITIPDSVTSIGEVAFYGCTGLMNIDLGDSITAISNSLFYGCANLTSATIPDSVTYIDKSAFYNCTSLTSVIIGTGITEIMSGSFDNCTSLTDIYYTGTEAEWNAIQKRTPNAAFFNATVHYNYVPAA